MDSVNAELLHLISIVKAFIIYGTVPGSLFRISGMRRRGFSFCTPIDQGFPNCSMVGMKFAIKGMEGVS